MRSNSGCKRFRWAWLAAGWICLSALAARGGLAQPIRFERSLENSIELVSVDLDQNGEAYHGFYLHPDGHLELAHALEIGVPHMTGRSTDALLFGEEILGRPVDEAVMERLTFHMLDSYDNVHHINAYMLNSDPHVEFHNLREGLHGLAVAFTDNGKLIGAWNQPDGRSDRQWPGLGLPGGGTDHLHAQPVRWTLYFLPRFRHR